MRKFKRNTVIIIWADALLIATACFFIFFVREVFPRKDYEHFVILTGYISVHIWIIVGIIYKFIGNKTVAKERKNWDDVINELPSEDRSTEEVIFLIAYIIMVIAFAITTPTMLIALWERHLDRQ
jgi:hypothetical protein